ncbi:hypothetical protein ACFYZT_32090 [Streptomyces sp. NPDC001591]|uniref:hypothetical protein n=1 Tax=Streptomyces sp. NPDC001591 TaxID=3364589 RepID=UPI00367BAF1F
MNRHTTRAILALTATAAALTIAAPAHATAHAPRPTAPTQPQDGLTDQIEALGKEAGATAEEIALIEQKIVSQNDGDDSGTDRGIIGMALDLLTGTPPEASPSPGGLVTHTGSGG